MQKKLTVWEAACIITGYGIGGGVLAMPYLTEKNGLPVSLMILCAAFAASLILHLMIAEVAIKAGGQVQIVEIFTRYLFTGKLKNVLRIAFFVVMLLVLTTNLAVYIAGAGEIITQLLPLSETLSRLLFYIVAAGVVIFGLKAVGVSEKFTMLSIFVVVAVLAVASLFRIRNPLPMHAGTVKEGLAYFGMVMFAFASFFSIPQAVKGLAADKAKVKKAVFWGLFNNFVLILVITLCALLASDTVTEVGMIGWSRGIGQWAALAGSIFTVLAMLTTYWSISLALGDIVREQTRMGNRLCWLIATAPSLILTLLGLGGFIEYMRLAGGVIAIIVAILVAPTYYRAMKGSEPILLGKLGGVWMQILIVIAYVLMAVGNVVTI